MFFRSIGTILKILALLILISCVKNAGMLSHHPEHGLDASTAWNMHHAKTEWWYFTGILKAVEGKSYFFQYTLFKGILWGVQGFSTHIALTDLETGKHFFEERNFMPSGKCKSSDKVIDCPNSILGFKKNVITCSFQGDSLDFHIVFDTLGFPAWHGTDGVIIIGDTTNPRQESYYFSYPSLSGSGKLNIKASSKDETDLKLDVEAEAWFDKQWGNFKRVAWDWFSLRFDNGDRLMLTSYPGHQHHEGTYLFADGRVERLNDFQLIAAHKEKRDMSNASWTIAVPDDKYVYSIRPVVDIPFHKSRFGAYYWEGICSITNEKGKKLGYAVVEIAR